MHLLQVSSTAWAHVCVSTYLQPSPYVGEETAFRIFKKWHLKNAKGGHQKIQLDVWQIINRKDGNTDSETRKRRSFFFSVCLDISACLMPQ